MSAPVRSRLGLAIVALPDLLPLAVAAFSLPTVVLLLLGQFHPWLVLPIGLLCAFVAVRAVGRPAGEVPRLAVSWSVLALGVALASLVSNAYLSSQDIVVTRDPSLYAVTAQWLAGHSALPIPTASDLFAGTPGLSYGSLGFRPHGDSTAVFPQGSHLVQSLLGLVGALFGQSALLKANALFGALAVLALFGLARRFAGGGWALVAAAALAGSMPLLHFSRAVYTEPLTLAMVVGGLSMLWRAQHSRRTADLAAAGLILGTAALARIDGSASLLFLLVLVPVSLALSPRGQRGAELVRSVVLLGSAAVPAVVGLLDLTRLAPDYAFDLSDELGLIGKAASALAVLGVLVVAVGWGTPLLERFLGLRRLPLAGAAGVVAYCLLLASRPLWLELHSTPAGYVEPLGLLQKGLANTVNPTRSYDENTVTWLSWYYGWPTLVLAGVGLTVLTFRCLRDRDLTLLPILALVGSVGSLYLWRASIFPDQIWAVRRFLPVVIPLALVAAAHALSVLWSLRGVGRLAAGLLGVAVVVLPLRTAEPLVTSREGVPVLDQLRNICRALPADAAVLMVDELTAARYAVTVKAYCDVPTVGLVAPTAAVLSQAYLTAASHGHTTWVLTSSLTGLALTAGSPTAGSTTQTRYWEKQLEGPPRIPLPISLTLFLGKVQPDRQVLLSAVASTPALLPG